eukprot:2699626-Pyramimonas_sp.AAC.1
MCPTRGDQQKGFVIIEKSALATNENNNNQPATPPGAGIHGVMDLDYSVYPRHIITGFLLEPA